jgi:hypothetical protein
MSHLGGGFIMELGKIDVIAMQLDNPCGSVNHTWFMTTHGNGHVAEWDGRPCGIGSAVYGNSLIAMGPGCHSVIAQDPRKEEKGNPLHPKDDG